MSAGTAHRMAISCPTCQTQMSVPREHAGKLARCPKCQNKFNIPALPATTENPAIPPIASVDPISAPFPSNPPAPFPGPATPQPPIAGGFAGQQFQPFGQPAQTPPVQQFGQLPNAPNGFPQVATESMTERAYRKDAEEGGGAFAPEKKGLDAGALGGVAMMLIAAVWFFVGLAANRIFFYPPILFIIGLVGFFKGIATGNFAGGKNRRR